jgi:hypothetical protein
LWFSISPNKNLDLKDSIELAKTLNGLRVAIMIIFNLAYIQGMVSVFVNFRLIRLGHKMNPRANQ